MSLRDSFVTPPSPCLTVKGLVISQSTAIKKVGLSGKLAGKLKKKNLHYSRFLTHTPSTPQQPEFRRNLPCLAWGSRNLSVSIRKSTLDCPEPKETDPEAAYSRRLSSRILSVQPQWHSHWVTKWLFCEMWSGH